MITICLHYSYDWTQQFLKFIQPALGKLDNFYIIIYTLLCMMIFNCLYTSYN